jgi:hypothetical protein
MVDSVSATNFDKEMYDSEKRFSEFLDELKIRWDYESPVYVKDERGRPRLWTPDFYLPDLGVYVEVCGTPDFKYDYRKKIYKDNKIPIVFIEEFKEPYRWKKALIAEIDKIQKERIDILKRL